MRGLRARAGGALVAVIFGLSGPANGQSESQLKPGDRVRIGAAAAKGKITGALVSLDDERLTVRPDESADSVNVPRDSITQLERLVGKKRCTLKGALAGALVGAALMAIYYSGENDLSQNSGTSDVIGGFAFFLLPSAAVGALVGTAIREDRWVRVPASPGTMREGRIEVGLTFRF